MSTIAEQVAAGAAWLDEKRPGWWRDIDLGRLDMADSCLCVLGQVFVRSAEGAVDEYGFEYELNGFAYAETQLAAPTAEGGFYVPVDWNSADGFQKAHERYAELGTEWKRLIAERRAAA